MRDEPHPGLRRIRQIRLHRLPELQRPILHLAPHRHRPSSEAFQMIAAGQHGEIRQGDLIRVAGDDGRHAEVLCGHGFGGQVELEVAAVVELGPLEFAVRGDEGVAGVEAEGEGDVLAVGGGGGDGWFYEYG